MKYSGLKINRYQPTLTPPLEKLFFFKKNKVHFFFPPTLTHPIICVYRKNNWNALFHLRCINVCIVVEELTPEKLQDTYHHIYIWWLVSVKGDISRDTDFSRDIFSLADGLKEVSKWTKKSCELTLVKYSNRLVSIKL